MVSTKKQRVTVFIDPSIAKQAKAQAINENFSLTELVEEALTRYLPKATIIKKSVTFIKR
jgi:predicted HicB family RNase H-like nuclease